MVIQQTTKERFREWDQLEQRLQKQSTPGVYEEVRTGCHAWNTLRVEEEERQIIGGQII